MLQESILLAIASRKWHECRSAQQINWLAAAVLSSWRIPMGFGNCMFELHVSVWSPSCADGLEFVS